MSVEHIVGDLLDYPSGINVIAHISNCQCTLGDGKATGIAGAIGKRYPAASIADRAAFMAHQARLGLMSSCEVEPGKRCVNLYAQEFYGKDRRHLDYEAIYSCLETLRDLLETALKEGRPYALGMPYKMGSDRSGGAWPVVLSMITYLFEASPIRCVIVQLPT